MGKNLLSTEEILLLNNLMYMRDSEEMHSVAQYQGKTIRDLIEDIDINQMNNHTEYTDGMTGDEWKEIICAVKNNDTLMNMKIASTYKDENYGGGESAVFINEASGEAVVAFQGTAVAPGGIEWKDNFYGGGPTDAADGVSTLNQERALEWYRSLDLEGKSVTITGHSKGGNKAKYIALLDDSVDRCVSFDGQGFSDEFMEKYRDQISRRQDVIENHNADCDFVNMLLNDIGKKYYYETTNVDSFVENHCTNAFLKVNPDGSCTMIRTDQSEIIKHMDSFLNSYFRSISSEEKAEVMALVGTLVEGGLSGEDINFYLDVLMDGDNLDKASYLIAYFLEYGEKYPEFFNSIETILNQMGMGEINKIVDMVLGVMNWKYYDLLRGLMNGISSHVPSWMWKLLSQFLKDRFGIELSDEELKRLLNVINETDRERDHIQIKENSGQDILFPSEKSSVDISSGTNFLEFSVKLHQMREAETCLEKIAIQLLDLSETVESMFPNGTWKVGKVNLNLEAALAAISRNREHCEKMAQVLKNCGLLYERTEQRITKNGG